MAWFVLLITLSGCSLLSPPTLIPTAASPIAQEPADTDPPAPPNSLPTATLIPTWTATLTPLPPTATPIPATTIALDPGVPPLLQDRLQTLIDSRPSEFRWAEPDSAEVIAGFNPTLTLGQWVYAAVAPFATVSDQLTGDELAAGWRGEAVGPFAGRPLLLDPETAAALSSHWGKPPAAAQLIEPGELLDQAWAQRPSWAIIPFEQLEPHWKVLRVDNLSPLDKPLSLVDYPLALPIGLRGRADKLEKVWIALESPADNLTNRDENQLTVIAMTGVTALVRATAFEMEINGMTYPGEEVGPVLQAADIAHISNEVSFAADCPYPDPGFQDTILRFCSDDRYLELLEYVGADVIELTGNHNNDWGTYANSRSLQLYQDRGWGVFGGGATDVEASQPFTLTHNGNTIGFIGCNPVGPASAWATAESPGAAYCTIESLAAAVLELATQVDIVVVGIQYHEHYSYNATYQQQLDFAALTAAGADIVSGSQGHHAQGFALPAEGGFIHYGLGNLFFDQMDGLGTRQTFVDRHIIYQGRHIATDLWTGLIENYARPRQMTAEERTLLLQTVFAASGW